jgi:hypothetical protein
VELLAKASEEIRQPGAPFHELRLQLRRNAHQLAELAKDGAAARGDAARGARRGARGAAPGKPPRGSLPLLTSRAAQTTRWTLSWTPAPWRPWCRC